MKERYVTITGTNHYYGAKLFSVGKEIKCIKENDDYCASESIKVIMKEIGTVGYIASSRRDVVIGTLSAIRIYDSVPNKFTIQVMFVVGSKVICRVL